MGRVLVNRSLSNRAQELTFSELRTSNTLGPNIIDSNAQGEATTIAPVEPVSVNQWLAMTEADQGLIDAVYNFINTTKEGLPLIPDNINGRNKKFFFNYYGTLGKSVKPAEIGQFEVNFFYPPNIQTGEETGTVTG